MEEIRSFGYICPHCGKAVLHQRSVFALSAAAARMECECGQEALEAETDGVRFRLWVPCGVCGGHHQAECSADAVLHGRGIGLACPEKQELCCYIGQEQQVRRAMEWFWSGENALIGLCFVTGSTASLWTTMKLIALPSLE